MYKTLLKKEREKESTNKHLSIEKNFNNKYIIINNYM